MTTTPNGWETRALGTLGQAVRLSVTPEAQTTYELWSVPSFSEGAPEIVNGSAIGSAKLRVEQGDVLICKINPRINRVWRVRDVGSTYESIASPEWLVFRPSDEVDGEYLRLCLTAPEFRNYIAESVSGVTGSHTRAKADRILRFEVPLPPLDEQRRIVAILEDHLSRLDAGAASMNRVLTRLESYRLALRGSAMSGFVGGESFGSEGWPQRTLDDLQANGTASITDGPFGSHLKSSHYTDSGVRVIRLQNVGLGEFLDAEAYISMEHFETLRRHEAVKGDLIVASLGDVLPRVCILPDLGGPAIVKADCIRVRLGEQVRPRWVLMSMLTPQARRWAKEQLHGVGRMRLGLKAIRGFSLPVPDLATQDAILDAVDHELERAASVEAAARKSLKLREAMQRSLLSAAFAGQLTKEPSLV